MILIISGTFRETEPRNLPRKLCDENQAEALPIFCGGDSVNGAKLA